MRKPLWKAAGEDPLPDPAVPVDALTEDERLTKAALEQDDSNQPYRPRTLDPEDRQLIADQRYGKPELAADELNAQVVDESELADGTHGVVVEKSSAVPA